MNGQVVLCKGVNDGEELDRTIRDLTKYIPTYAECFGRAGRSLEVPGWLCIRLEPFTPEQLRR